MIGMSQIRKKFYMGIGIGSIIGILGIIISGIMTISIKKSYENGTNAEYNKKFTKEIIVTKESIMQGTVVTDDMVHKVRVHNSMVPNKSLSQVDNISVAKYNIAANTAISEDMLTEDIQKSDVRLQEINTVVMPIDLDDEEYIDIRIMYPNGTDYIVLAEKKVENIVNDTMILRLSEDERLRLNAAMIDSFLNDGTKLYATKYVDPSSQINLEETTEEKIKGILLNLIRKELPEFVISSETEENKINFNDDQYVSKIYDFIVKYRNLVASTTSTIETYQPNQQVIEAMNANPNIINEAKQKLSKENRENLERLLSQYKVQTGEGYDSVISGAQESINKQKEERNGLLSDEE